MRLTAREKALLRHTKAGALAAQDGQRLSRSAAGAVAGGARRQRDRALSRRILQPRDVHAAGGLGLTLATSLHGSGDPPPIPPPGAPCGAGDRRRHRPRRHGDPHLQRRQAPGRLHLAKPVLWRAGGSALRAGAGGHDGNRRRACARRPAPAVRLPDRPPAGGDHRVRAAGNGGGGGFAALPRRLPRSGDAAAGDAAAGRRRIDGARPRSTAAGGGAIASRAGGCG